MTTVFHVAQNGELVGSGPAKRDVEESKRAGTDVYLIPANATTVAPPARGASQVPVWDGAAWAVVSDRRGEHYWLPDGSELVIESLGFTPPIEALSVAPIAVLLAQARAQKSVELKAVFEVANRALLESSALGNAHTYDAEPHNEANLIGLIAAGVDPAPFTCDNGSTKAQRSHTLVQLQVVARDGATRRLALIAQLRARLASVDAAVDVAAVEAVSW
ncbi:MAG: hypothetical protein ACI9W2_003197 [Gammaproteobacteria bacterium]|jgi:hypothetical protein